MSKIIKLCKGLDIRLQGEAAKTIVDAPKASEYAVSPLDFEGVTPKMLVKVGDKVEAGSPLFFDKKRPEILFTSPVSGEVAAVNRGGVDEWGDYSGDTMLIDPYGQPIAECKEVLV